MTSKISFCKQVRQELRRTMWAVTLSIVGFLFCLPIPIAMIIQRYFEQINLHEQGILQYGGTETAANILQNYGSQVQYYLEMLNPMVRFGIGIMAVLCGVALFRYLHDHRQVDLIHALPIKRERIFAVRFVTGIVAVLPVVILMRVLSAVVVAIMGFGAYIVPTSILQAIVTDCVFFVLIYAVCAVCTVLTGNTIIAVLLSAWWMFIVPAMTLLWNGLLLSFTSTMASFSQLSVQLCTRTSPILQYAILGYNNQSLIESYNYSSTTSVNLLLVIYAVVAVAHIVLAVLLFRARKSETAGQAIAFTKLKAPLKWSLCLLAGGCGYLLFNAIGKHVIWGIFGMLFLAIIVHCFAEIVLQNDFKAIFAHKRQLVAIGVLLVGVFFGLQVDVIGYDSYLPKIDNIQGVQARISYQNTYTDANAGNYYNYYGEQYYLTDPEVIAAVHRLGEIGIANADSNIQNDTYSADDNVGCTYIVLFYDTLFGQTSRQYTIEWTDEVKQLANTIRTSRQFIEKNSQVYRVSQAWTQDQSAMEVRTPYTPYSGTAVATVYDTDIIVEIFQSLQSEMLTLTMEQRENEVPVLRLDARGYEMLDGGVNSRWHSIQDVGVYPSFVNTLALIEKYTSIVPTKITAEDVSYITISRYVNELDDMIYAKKYGYEYAAPTEIEYDTASAGYEEYIVTDPADIDALLANGLPNSMWSATDVAFVHDEACIANNVTINSSEFSLIYPQGQFPTAVFDKYLN